GAGPAGPVAALTLLQNGILIDKDSSPRIGQRGVGILPRSLNFFNFLSVPEVDDLGKTGPMARYYMPGTFVVAPHIEPTFTIPF
ncbi:hypothetical protein DFJ58DRAFT_625402, partial [Suillus subalutaceus]|uniref:uncharacterized protein n=1 Tax=Suillus subalutaceus TaxID=48586 RepID=UPI001B869DAE